MTRRAISSARGGPRRGLAFREQPTRYFIATEGIAEQALARWLESLLTEKGRQVFFKIQKIGHGAGGPEPLVAKAAKQKKRFEKKEFHRSFLFLDRDKYHENGPAAERLANTENLNLFWQCQNIEGLFLRFFDGCENNWPPANQTERALEHLWDGYDKSAVSRMDLSERFSEESLMRTRRYDEHLNTLLGLLGFDD